MIDSCDCFGEDEFEIGELISEGDVRDLGWVKNLLH
jgi:hypothetical protein